MAERPAPKPPTPPCPQCKLPTPYTTANRWRPFCSERCRSIDLGAWATERYRVAAEAPDDGDESQTPRTH